MHSYDADAHGLGELAEDSDEDSAQKRTSFEDGRIGGPGGSFAIPKRARTDLVDTAEGKGAIR